MVMFRLAVMLPLVVELVMSAVIIASSSEVISLSSSPWDAATAGTGA
jgi:hypothetical protein